jgi:hypothetical protein
MEIRHQRWDSSAVTVVIRQHSLTGQTQIQLSIARKSPPLRTPIWQTVSSCAILSSQAEPKGGSMNLDSKAARSPLFYVLVIALATTVSCSCPPAPSITSISPTSTTAGGDPVELTIDGDNFLSTSTVDINGILAPSYVNSHQLVATIPATAIAQPGTLNVLVLNPPGSGGSTGSIGGITTSSNATCAGNNSNSVSFTVNP